MKILTCYRCGAEIVVFWVDLIRWYEFLGMAVATIFVWEIAKTSLNELFPRLEHGSSHRRKTGDPRR